MRKSRCIVSAAVTALAIGVLGAVVTGGTAFAATQDVIPGPTRCDAPVTVTVPPAATSVTVTLRGGAGSAGGEGFFDFFDLGTGGAGGKGASVTATIPVKPGGSITVVAGCAGRGTGRRSGGAGFARGGAGGSGGGGGGGASAVCTGTSCSAATPATDLLAVAGGGGGGGEAACPFIGGGIGGQAGTGPSAVNGGGAGPAGMAGTAGGSGFYFSGGNGGSGGTDANGYHPDGQAGRGNWFATDSGGGGAGYDGGGAGASTHDCGGGGGGGAGSTWVTDAATAVTTGASTVRGGSVSSLAFAIGPTVETPLGALGGLGLAVVAGGGMVAVTGYRRRRARD